MSAPHGGEPFVLFDVAGATYALRSADIQQLDMVGAITPVPNAPEFVDGVVSVRGEVIPAVNLRVRFGFPRIAFDRSSRILVVRAGGRTIGIIADSAREFTTIEPASIQPPPEAVTGLSGRYLEGIAHLGERLVLVLRAADLVAPESMELSPSTGGADDATRETES